MLDKLKAALGITPAPKHFDDLHTAVVPINRGIQMGAMDRMPDSSRPTLQPAPPLRTWDVETRITNMPAQAQARHAASVSGFIAYGLELLQAWAVGGDGLRPSVTPDAAELGWTPEYAVEWGNSVERVFAEWANDAASCDAQGRLAFAGIQAQALRSYMLCGDAFAGLDYGPKPHAAWRTAVQMVDPLRITFASSSRPGVTVRNGVELDDRGRAIAYHLRALHDVGRTERVPVFGGNGRRLLLHLFDAEVGAVRGVSPLAPAIGGLLQGMQAADAAVMASQIHALILGTITSDLPNADLIRALGGEGNSNNPIARMMAARVEWHEELKKAHNDVQLGRNARIIPLSSGERLDLHGGGKGAFQAYDTILEHTLREVARALGLSYQAVSGDLSSATYASLKYSVTETRPIVIRKRKTIVEPLCRWALAAVIEEAIATRRIPFEVAKRPYRSLSPLEAFRELKRFALKSTWIGPQIEDPDALKATRASVERVRAGLSSLSEEIELSGRDPEAVFDQIGRDREALRRRGIYLPQFTDKRPVVHQNKGGSA